MPDNKNKLALITGGSSGIGAEYARQLAREGFDILIVARREKLMKKLCGKLKKDFGIKADYLVVELADRKQLDKLATKVAKISNLAFLINNAGFGTRGYFVEKSIEVQQSMVDVHVTATLSLTHAALPRMIKNGSGNIINVSSVAAFLYGPEASIYCSTKALLNTFTESLSIELIGTGINVQALCPGYTLSDFHKKMDAAPTGRRLKAFMSAEKVVEISLREMAKRKAICIPGFKNKLIVFIIKCLPKWLYRLMAKKGRKKSGENDSKN